MDGEENVQDWDTSRDAAVTFLEACGIIPTPDAISQLIEVYLPAIAIMCKRGYDPNGQTWQKVGWRPQLYEVMKKVDRIAWLAWSHNREEEALAEIPDILNYLGFVQRGITARLAKWGKWGPPG